MRIQIIGLSGSGKSTLAHKMSEKLQIPYLQIDRVWFEAGGHKSQQSDVEDRERVRSYIKVKVENFIIQDAWVSDGWYVHELIAERADQIIFLDIPLGMRLANHLRRTFFSERHSELTKWDDIKFVYQIVRRTLKHGPKMREFVKENASKVKTFNTYKEIDSYLAGLKK